MRIYDDLNKEKKAILCEQIIGNIDSHFYECSFIQRGKHIYYFKRINKRHK